MPFSPVPGVSAANPTFTGIITTGGAVKFPSVQVPSADVNTLDDYVEGTWTPVLSFGGASVGITYGTQLGRVTKVGRLAHVEMTILLTSKGSSAGTLAIAGIPYAPGMNTPAIVITNGFAATVHQLVGFLPAATQIFNMYSFGPVSSVPIADTDLSNTSSINMHCTFSV